MLRKTKLAAQLKFRVRSPKMLSQQILESTGIRLRSRETKHVRRDIKSLAFLTSSTFNSDMLFKLHKGSKGRFCVKQFLKKQHGIFLLRWGKTMCREETRPRRRAQIRKQLTRKEGSWTSALATLECLTMWARQRTAAATKQVLP